MASFAMNEDSMGSVRGGAASTAGGPRKAGTAASGGAKITQDPRDRETFYKDLYSYHDNKGTPIDRVPRINGREIDLHRLYNLVIGRGGWAKVNYRNEWDELVAEFEVSAKCVNAAVALKQIYMRFLDRYEKLHFQSDDNDRLDDADDDNNRHKKWNNKNLLNEVPLKYNYGQHVVSDQLRAVHKMSTDLYNATEYDRLIMSLMSPLPNEQDFAINVCTLMSNESKHTLKIDNCPKLLEVLLGHAGVYSHYTLRSIFLEFYAKIRRNSLQSFWTDCLRDRPNILELAYDDYADLPADRDMPGDADAFEDGLNCQRASELFDFDGLDFLNLRRGLGTHDYIGQRVHQIATILRNLSYSDENTATLVRNKSFVRFLVMCANIRWGNLHHMGLDMLGNIAADLELCDPAADDLARSLLSTVAEGLESPDRGVIITCLEVLHKLCRHEQNEDHLLKCLTKRTYAQICMYLSLNDIMLLLYTLECIYALSALGERSCANIVQVTGLIGQLVSLVTVEAQSYGPDGCILMRVVETVPSSSLAAMQASGGGGQPGTVLMGQAPSTPVNRSWHTLAPASVQGVAAVAADSSTGSFVPFAGAQQPLVDCNKPLPNVPFQVASTTPPLQRPLQPIMPIKAQPVVATPVPIKSEALSSGIVVTSTVPTTIPTTVPTTAAATTQPNAPAIKTHTPQQQIMADNEQFACTWLRATFEQLAAPTMGRIEQQDLYRMYLTASAKLGRAGVASQLHFPRAVRSVFGATVGPNVAKLSGHDVATPTTTATLYYEGLRIRAKPLPVVHKGTILQGHVQHAESVIKNEPKDVIKVEQNTVSTPSSPAVVSSPSPANPPTMKPTVTAASSAAVVASVITTTPTTPASASAASASSSSSSSSTALIKSLLANKVTTNPAAVVSSSDVIPAAAAPTTATMHHKVVVGGPLLVASPSSTSLITANVNVHQVTQRQLLQKEKELAIQQQQQQQHQQLHHQQSVVFKPVSRLDNVPPPLAPLSSGTGDISSTTSAALLLPDASSNNAGDADADGGKHSPVVTSNKMLADLLDRKSGGPPFVAGDNKLKRKMDVLGETTTTTTTNKRPAGGDDAAGSAAKVPSSNAANLYAKLAASLLEDEDMEEEETATVVQTTSQVQQQPQETVVGQQFFKRPVLVDASGMAVQLNTIQQQQQQPMQQQRQQIIVGPQQLNKPLIIQQTPGAGMQPMILQQTGPGGQISNFHITQGQGGQQMLQPIMQAQMSPQYMLATNSQGQTYLVAQQPTAAPIAMQPQQQLQQQPQQQAQQQTVLVQGSGANKTIYILQQPVQQQPQQQPQQQQQTAIVKAGQTPQKMIMTSAAGQPVQLVQRQQNVIVQQQQQQPTLQPIVQSTNVVQQPAQILVQQTNVVTQPPQLVQQQPQQPKLIAVNKTNKPMPQQLQPQQQPPQPQPQLQQQQQPQQQQPNKLPTLQQKQPSPPQLAQQQPQQPRSATPNTVASAATAQPSSTTTNNQTAAPPKKPPTPPVASVVAVVTKPKEDDTDPNWLYVCDWRGCPRKRFRSANELYLHTCQVHCPDNIDPNAEIYCQWGDGPNLCDNMPRKRFSLMTHLFDRHLPVKSLKKAIHRRIHAPPPPPNAPTAPVTIIKNPVTAAAAGGGADGTGGGTWPSSPNAASAAMQAIKRHAMDFVNPKELMDENEGPVTKSIRLTAALILRNLVNYTGSAKRSLRYYEPHLAGVALSNVESSRTIAQVLYEMSESRIRN